MMSVSEISREERLKGKIPGDDTGIEIRRTTCGICTQNCGMNAYVKDGRIIKVEGTRENAATGGTLCAKGAAARQYVYHPDRIKTPLLRRGKAGTLTPVSWDDAMQVFSDNLLQIKEETGPESVAFFCGYPKRLRLLLKRLTHGFGSPNYCTESSTCYFATVMANKLNYGIGGGPDMKKTKCLMVWSANPFYSRTSQVRHLMTAMENGLKVIEVGPLTTPLTRHAHLHLRIRPGTSGALALGLAHVIIKEKRYDQEFVEHWTTGFDAYKAYVEEFTPAVTEEITWVPADKIIQAARLYAGSGPAAIMSGACPTVHHTNGVQNHRAITALIGLTGNFDRPGGNCSTTSSYYHQSAGLNTREAAFEQVRAFEDMAPRIGEDAHPLWCRLVPEAQSMHIPLQINAQTPYPVRAMVGFGLNYRMWPGSDYMRDSLKKLDFLTVVDLFMTDTARLADLVLPACSSFEKSDLRIWPNRYAIWTEPTIDPVGQSRPDADIIIDMVKALGLDDPLMGQGLEACLDWVFAPSGITMQEIQAHPDGYTIQNRPRPGYEKYKPGGFATPSGKMEFVSSLLENAGVDPLPRYTEPKYSPVSTPDLAREYPFILTTGARLPMFIHSRTFRMPWTRQLRSDPMVDMNPRDAVEKGILQGDAVRLSTARAFITVKANLTQKVMPGVVSMYHGYPEADVNLLIPPDYRDPVSGYPGFKSLLCNIEKAGEVEK